MTELEGLVSAGDIEGALRYADGLTPQRIASLISGEASMKHPAEFAEFYQRLFYGERNAAIRFDIVRYFAQAFLGEVAPTDAAAGVATEMTLIAIQDMIDALASFLRSRETEVWVSSPDRVLPPATFARWVSYADQLDQMNVFPTADESGKHRSATETLFASMGESWLATLSPAQRRRVEEGRDRFDIRGDR
jgi:hypothetical protein